MIPILDLTRQYAAIQPRIDEALIRVAASGHYILGPEVKAFEGEMAQYLGAKHVVGCANGTDALYLALRALEIGPGDEVITTPFSFIATSEAIVRVGAKPVFTDVDPVTLNMDVSGIERLITPHTRAILPVHIFGQPADMDALGAVAQKHKLFIVEDCAQSIGSAYHGRKTGAIGDIGCFSFFPSKNLGAMGDGGMTTTNDDQLAERLRMLRVHGSRERYHHTEPGINSRLDEMQAAILRVKLEHLDAWNAARREVACRYNGMLDALNLPIETPKVPEGLLHAFHQYTIRLNVPDAKRVRADIQREMQAAGVQTMIYYPIPLYRQATHADLGCDPADYPVCDRASDQVLSLPMFPELTEAEQRTVVDALAKVLGQRPAVIA